MPKPSRKDAESVRALVRIRDKGYCQMCGKWFPYLNIHHRINKGSGGSALFDRPSLLIQLCGSGTTGDHGWVTNHPDAAGMTGWLLPRNNPDIDPTQEPILTFEGWWLLDDEGGRIAVESPLLRAGGD